MSGTAQLIAAKVLNDDTVSPGWLGLVVVLAMGAALALLLRSFRNQLRRVPPTFDPPGATQPPAAPGQAATSAQPPDAATPDRPDAGA